MSELTLSQWLSRIEQLHPSEIELGLDRVRAVARRLGLFEHFPMVITVGGTNGKGSCITIMDRIARLSGKHTGVYLSPHLIHYNERVQINGVNACDNTLVKSFERVEEARQDTALTLFEFGTLSALDIFARSSLDLVLLEVGLGGRLDAVNIMEPEVSVITSVDIDHTDLLGDTREQIGREKAGIFRKGKTAICGDANIPRSVESSAVTLGSPLLVRDRDFGCQQQAGTGKTWSFQGRQQNGDPVLFKELPSPTLALDNAVTAIQASLAAGFPASSKLLSAALKQVQLRGRQEVLEDGRLMMDVGHNPHAARLLAARLSHKNQGGKILCVVAMLAHKDLSGTLKELIGSVDHWFTCSLDTPGGADGKTLADIIRSRGGHVNNIYTNPKTGYNSAIKKCREQDMVVVFGSFYTVAAVCELRQFNH